MIYGIYLLAVVSVYKLISNIARLIKIKYFRKQYKKFITDGSVDFAQYSYAIKNLFNVAKVADYKVALCELVGFGHIQTGNISVFENMAIYRADIIAVMLGCFSKAEGTFKSRIFECFSPLYWIECIIFLPQKLIEYFGLDEDCVLAKLIQIVYWLTSPLFLMFRDQIYTYITELIGKV